MRQATRGTTIVAVDYPDPPPDWYGGGRLGGGIGIAMFSAILAAMICEGEDLLPIIVLALVLVFLVVAFVQDGVEEKRRRKRKDQ